MLQNSDFFTEVKVAKSSDIGRNMRPSITRAHHNVNICQPK